MKLRRGSLTIGIKPEIGIGYELQDVPRCFIPVGGRISLAHAQNLGIRAGELNERHVAFFLLLVLDRNGELRPRTVVGKQRSQRLRFAEQLGITAGGLAKWLERYLKRKSGRILRWDHLVYGKQPSKTGGPWLLDVTETIVEPDCKDSNASMIFLAGQCETNLYRGSDPAGLLADALSARAAGRWAEALKLLGEAERMLLRRSWSRETPLRFEIYLVRAGTEMQLGAPTLAPKTCYNIQRSISIQRLGGPQADLVRAQAHYIAALVHNQSDNPADVEKVFAYLERARELVKGRTDHAAVREYWKYSSYLELTESRQTGVVRPKRSSAILQAGRVIEETYDQEQMRYGDALLEAGRPAEAIDYIQPALESGRLSQQAWIIAERLEATARWAAGAKSGRILGALASVEGRAESLGFNHQVRIIRRTRNCIREGVRSMQTR